MTKTVYERLKDLLVLSNDLLWSDWSHTVICLRHDTMQIKLCCHFKQVAGGHAVCGYRLLAAHRLNEQVAVRARGLQGCRCCQRRLGYLISVGVVAHGNFLHCLGHHGHLDLKGQDRFVKSD